MRETIDQKYIALAAKYGVALRVTHVSDDSAPVQEIVSGEEGAEIRLNVSKIKDEEYETYLTYNVREVLLPKLVLETERLRIRHCEDKDAEHLFEVFHDRESCYNDGGYEPFESMDEEYAELIELFKSAEGRYVVALKESDEAIGVVNLMLCRDRAVETNELGYRINPSKRRQGYTFEAVSTLLDFVLNELHLDMVVAGALEDNIPSLNMLKKLGFTFEGRKHKAFWHPVKGAVDLLYHYKER